MCSVFQDSVQKCIVYHKQVMYVDSEGTLLSVSGRSELEDGMDVVLKPDRKQCVHKGALKYLLERATLM